MTAARSWRTGVVLVVVIAAVIGVANLPTETRQGVNFVLTRSRLPLYVKALEFVQRDVSYGRVARQIADSGTSAEARVLAVFEWTRANIRDTPHGFPIVDDHVWHIIVRGYGEDDQKADVFATLATYAGVPSFWAFSQDASRELPLSFSWIDRKWALFDVANGIVFRSASGTLLSADEMATTPHLVDRVAAGRLYRGRPYRSYFDGFRPPVAPEVLRSEMQMVWPRMTHRVRRVIGLGRREWQQ